MQSVMKQSRPDISIVTPSFNMLLNLKLCHASISDQGIAFEHVVVDGGSTDGTQQWLLENKCIRSVSEKDSGMYNALNKAIDLANGDIIGHLNCDEQYLPGVLAEVRAFFEIHPEIDFIAGDFIVIDKNGEFVAFRKSFQPRWPYFFSNYLYTTTCTLFYRKHIFERCRFDESYKSIADVIFLYDVISKGFKGKHLRKYFSAFTYSGTNLSLHPISGIEKKRFNKTLPLWFKTLKPIFFLLFFVERIAKKTYVEKSPLSFSIFSGNDLVKRIEKTKINPGFRVKFQRSA
jgi:glycosyltransferase involved in cell wall biosynthesis